MLCLTWISISFQVQAAQTCSPSASTAWQVCGPIESPNGLSLQPSVIQASDGTLQMVWMGHPNLNYVIMYASRNLTGGWSPGSSITTQGGINQNPTIVQFTNGTSAMFWAYKPASSRHFQLYFITQDAGVFSKQYKTVPLTNPTNLNDTQPSATLGKDGTLWLVWTRDNSTVSATAHVMRQLWYETLKGSVWSTEQPLTSASDVNWNFQPSVMVGKDGLVRIAYSRGQSSLGNFQIYLLTQSGPGWGSPVQLTTATTGDVNPSITQDRNGTLWIFWARNLPVGTSTAYLILDRSSWDNGANWMTESVLSPTPNCTTVCVDSEYPAAVQSTLDDHIWVFYSSNPVSGFNIWALETTARIFPVHDVAISYFSSNVSQVYQGGFHEPYTASGVPIIESAVVQVLVVVQNAGDFNENVSIRLTATNTTNYSLGVQILQISAGTSGAAYFNFDTTNAKPARYGISGNASIPGRTLGNTQDGLLSTPNLIHVLPLGDVDQDGSVTITDVTVIFYNYGFSCYTPATCSPRFIAAQWGDVNGNGIIDISDAGVVAHNFGTYT